MSLDPEQSSILRRSAVAIAVTVAVLVAGYVWRPPGFFGLSNSMGVGERLAFALKVDLLIFLWLAGCVRAVASGRFRSKADRPGAAYSPPSEFLAVRAAVLQNSLEQTVLAAGSHLILATVLRGAELVLIPLLVILYLAGRIAFAATYAKGAAARAFGMALTGTSVVAGYGIAAGLIIAGR